MKMLTIAALCGTILLAGCDVVKNADGTTNVLGTIEATATQDTPAVVTATCGLMTAADTGFQIWLASKSTSKPAIAQAVKQEAISQATFHPICAANDAGQLVSGTQALAAIQAAYAAFVNSVAVAKAS